MPIDFSHELEFFEREEPTATPTNADAELAQWLRGFADDEYMEGVAGTLRLIADRLDAERALADDVAAVLDKGTIVSSKQRDEVERVLARYREARGL